MKRLDFLKEMKKSLMNTVNAVSAPFLEEDIKRLETASEKLLNIKWVYVGDELNLSSSIEQRFLNGKPVLLVDDNGTIRAYSAICSECSYLFVVSTLYSTVKCFNCEKEYEFIRKIGDLSLVQYEIEKKVDGFYIALEAQS